MYFKLIFTVIILVITHLYSWSQNPDTTNFETFDYMHEGEKYVMQQYFLVFIKRGENKSCLWYSFFDLGHRFFIAQFEIYICIE